MRNVAANVHFVQKSIDFSRILDIICFVVLELERS